MNDSPNNAPLEALDIEATELLELIDNLPNNCTLIKLLPSFPSNTASGSADLITNRKLLVIFLQLINNLQNNFTQLIKLPPSLPSNTAPGSAVLSTNRILSVIFLPENIGLYVFAGTSVVIGQQTRQEDKLKKGEIVQGKQLDGGHKWYVGLADRSLQTVHCVLQWDDTTRSWTLQNQETKFGTRMWHKEKFKKLGHKPVVPVVLTNLTKTFQLGKRSELVDSNENQENHVIKIKVVEVPAR